MEVRGIAFGLRQIKTPSFLYVGFMARRRRSSTRVEMPDMGAGEVTRADVCYWHLADVQAALMNVRFDAIAILSSMALHGGRPLAASKRPPRAQGSPRVYTALIWELEVLD